MDKFDVSRYHQACTKKKRNIQTLKARASQRLKESEDLFTAQGIEFYKRSNAVWLLTIGEEKFSYNAETGHWKPLGGDKPYQSSSPQAFLDSVRKNA